MKRYPEEHTCLDYFHFFAQRYDSDTHLFENFRIEISQYFLLNTIMEIHQFFLRILQIASYLRVLLLNIRHSSCINFIVHSFILKVKVTYICTVVTRKKMLQLTKNYVTFHYIETIDCCYFDNGHTEGNIWRVSFFYINRKYIRALTVNRITWYFVVIFAT